MNAFKAYRGILLNGRLIESEDFISTEPTDSFEKEVLAYCHHLFDDSKNTTVKTSGSTGAPKELVFAKSALIKSAEETNNYFKLNSQSRALLALPLQYVAAKLMVVRAIIGGYDLVTTIPSSNPLKNLNKKISFVPLTPHQAATALSESLQSFDHLETVLLGGGEISEGLRQRLSALKTNAYVGFGMAETLTHFALSRIESDAETVFHKLPSADIDVDEQGCLTVNRQGITDGTIQTNDLVELTSDGFRWLGRIDNLINSGGVKIIPEEVEKKLKSKISSDFFVAGIPDSTLGQKVVLFVEGPEKTDLNEVDFSSKYQRPKEVIHLEKFLYTKSGKIRRKETVKEYLDSSDY